jgi:hypothetical protein
MSHFMRDDHSLDIFREERLGRNRRRGKVKRENRYGVFDGEKIVPLKHVFGAEYVSAQHEPTSDF